MGRKSKLTDEQWVEFARRHAGGESMRSLAREFGISEASAREKISAQSAQVKKVANQIVETKMALSDLPVSAQISAHNLADKLMSIHSNLQDAAVAGAQTASLMSQISLATLFKKESIDEVDIKTAMSASMTANAAAKIGMDLLALATKPGAVKQDNSGPGSKLVTLTPEQIKQINEEIRNAV
jgi:hypothetical protein